jgi:hypothetical protein
MVASSVEGFMASSKKTDREPKLEAEDTQGAEIGSGSYHGVLVVLR